MQLLKTSDRCISHFWCLYLMLTARKVAPRTIPQEAVTHKIVYTVGSTRVCSTWSDLNWEVVVVLFTLLNVRSFGGLDLLLNIGHVTGLHLSVKTCFNIPFFLFMCQDFTSPCEECESLLNILLCTVPPPLNLDCLSTAANDRICFLVGKIIQQVTKAFLISSYQYALLTIQVHHILRWYLIP